MMVRNRMVKPQKVKAWARPGTVHCSNFFCPPTSTSSALTRLGRSLKRLGTAGWPAEMSLNSQKNRRPAMANITAVIPRPTASLRGTAFLLGGYYRVTKLARPVDLESRSWAEVVGIPAGGRAPLTLVLRLEPVRTVGVVGRRGHLEKADLADLHTRVDRDGQVGDVGELEGEVTVPTGVDEAGRRVDEETEPAERGLALEAGHQVGGQGDLLLRRPEHELTGVEDEGVLPDIHQLGEVLLVLAHVDDPAGVVAEEPEVLVDVEVDRRGLDTALVEGSITI